MRTPTLSSTADMWGAFERVAVRPHARLRWNTCFKGAEKRSASFESVPRSLMVLMKAFEFFHLALETS